MAQSRQGSHAKAFLDTLFSSSLKNAAPASSSSATLLTPTFKPHTPSSLSSSASASASEDGGVEPSVLRTSSTDGAESDSDGSGSLLATSPSFSSSFKAAQLSMQTLSHFTASPSASSSRRTSTSASTVADSSAELLAILNNELLDEDERIEKVHSVLAAALYAIEGIASPSSRIDGLVLDLLHRHREDKYPTGATFSPVPVQSPSRRPASIRSTSSRPWTPSRPPFSASSSFNLGHDPSAVFTTPQQPTSPLVASTPTSATVASASPRQHPGVIGSGSPRASPRPWNRTLSNLSTTGMTSLTASGPSVSSPIAVIGATSRPVSPSPFGSPRLNISATEFKPRNASSTNLAAGAASLTPTRPAPLLTRSSSSTSSTNLALANKSHATADDEDEEDEFSPFAIAKPMQSMPSYSHSDYESDTGGYLPHDDASWSGGSWVPPPTLDQLSSSNDDVTGETAAALTPFDMLYSILVTGTKAGTSEWSPEQVDEALVLHQYDVEKTLNAIWENDGKPLGDGTRSSMSGYVARTVLTSGSASPRFTPATAAVKAGVNVLPREALAQRGGGGRTLTSTKGAPAQPPAAAAAAAAAGGGIGANRVCRYYLAGECRRSDCKFSHDLENRTVCRYWLKGQCAHDPCNFLHDYDALNQLASGIASGLQVDDTGAGVAESDVQTPVRDEFPELGRASGAKGSYAAATLGSASSESRNRWAATVQKRAPSDAMSQVMSKDPSAGVISIHSKAGPAGRGSTSSSSVKSGRGASRAAVSGRLALRAPLLLPTLATGKQAAASYAAHRGDSLTLAERRNKLLVRAADAFGRNDVNAARKLSKEASSINTQYEDEARTASRDLLRDRMAELASRVRDDAGTSAGAHLSDEPGVRSQRGKPAGGGLGIHLGVVRRSSLPANCATLSADERSEALLDLHALHAHEAVELTEHFLLGLESESFHGLAFLAVGKESHTAKSTHRRRVHLASALKHFLATYAYPFAECDSVLVVDHLTHT